MILTAFRTTIGRNLFGAIQSRQLYISSVVQSTNKSPLFILRQKTGLAYNLCREALNKHDNNVDQAEAWLKAQALAHGLQKATKVRDRSAREGLVGIAIRQDQKMASVLELNCETDFVAKNQLFRDLALSLTEQVATNLADCEAHSIPNVDLIKELRPAKKLLSSIDEQIVELITKLGENIRLQRAFHLGTNDTKTYLFGQIHAQTGHKCTGTLDVMSGRFGAFTALRCNNKDSECDLHTLKGIGNRLCRHVIGFSPSYIELPDNIRKHLEEVEKEQAAKSAKVDENVQDGEEELSDVEESHLSQNNRDDWPSIMDQQLIMSDNLTVRDFCKENQVSIVHFQRFECGDST